MNFLICGFGNIAQRHFRNLKRLRSGCKIDVYTHRKKSFRIFDKDLNVSHTTNLFKKYDIENIYFDIDEALDSKKYDAVMVCSLPPERIDIAIKVANKGLNLFIEKPLSDNEVCVSLLASIVDDKKIKCAVGYQMRFHPALQKIKKLIKERFFGTIYRVEVTHGNSITNWTKGRNLKEFYALDPNKGGGLVLSQIHEIDYLQWLFNDKMDISSVEGGKVKYKIEDNISILGTLMYKISEHNFYTVKLNINLDFLSPVPIRNLRIYGTKRSTNIDLITNSIWYKNTKDMDRFDILWNDLFLDEMDTFLNSLNKNKLLKPLANIHDGVSSLETALEVDNFNC